MTPAALPDDELRICLRASAWLWLMGCLTRELARMRGLYTCGRRQHPQRHSRRGSATGPSTRPLCSACLEMEAPSTRVSGLKGCLLPTVWAAGIAEILVPPLREHCHLAVPRGGLSPGRAAPSRFYANSLSFRLPVYVHRPVHPASSRGTVTAPPALLFGGLLRSDPASLVGTESISSTLSRNLPNARFSGR